MGKIKKILLKITRSLYSRLFSWHKPQFPEKKLIEKKKSKPEDKSKAEKISKPEVKSKSAKKSNKQVFKNEKSKPEISYNRNGKTLEQLVSDIFIQRGYTISNTLSDKYGAVDMVLQMNKETTFVLYKDGQDQQMEVDAVAGFYELISSEGAKHGVIITSGNFNSAVINFSLGKSLLLINGLDLQKMINALEPEASSTAKQTDISRQSASNMDIEAQSQIEGIQAEMPELEPLCPICSREMVKRTAKKGKKAGHTFWGCSQFPRCRGVVANEN